MDSSSCLFCLSNIKARIIFEDNLAYVISDKYPVSKGHLLIIPKQHYKTWFDAPLELQNHLMNLTNQLKELLDNQYNPQGYNIGINCGKAAGQSINHLHVHLIPRYQNDMKNPKGGVRGVIPEKQSY